MRQFFDEKKNGAFDVKFVGIISYSRASPMRFLTIQIVHYFQARGKRDAREG